MAEIHKQNRGFRTSDLFGLVLLVGVSGSLFGAILAEALNDDRPARARSSAEALARQLENQQKSSAVQILAQRGPASVESQITPQLTSGNIGRDPWGRPFHYQVRKALSQSSPMRIYVWSDGPDGKADTMLGDLEKQSPHSLQMIGDDVGYIEETKAEI